jgi:hypothetical protein
MSILHIYVHAACPCPRCMSMLTLHVHVYAACPSICCVFMSTLNAHVFCLYVHVHAACPRPCCIACLEHVMMSAWTPPAPEDRIPADYPRRLAPVTQQHKGQQRQNPLYKMYGNWGRICCNICSPRFFVRSGGGLQQLNMQYGHGHEAWTSIYAACPCSCPCYMSTSLLHINIYVHAACSCLC